MSVGTLAKRGRTTLSNNKQVKEMIVEASDIIDTTSFKDSNIRPILIVTAYPLASSPYEPTKEA